MYRCRVRVVVADDHTEFFNNKTLQTMAAYHPSAEGQGSFSCWLPGTSVFRALHEVELNLDDGGIKGTIIVSLQEAEQIMAFWYSPFRSADWIDLGHLEER